jgi:hypothetical protein
MSTRHATADLVSLRALRSIWGQSIPWDCFSLWLIE